MNVRRVQEWRRENPGYSRKSRRQEREPSVSREFDRLLRGLGVDRQQKSPIRNGDRALRIVGEGVGFVYVALVGLLIRLRGDALRIDGRAAGDLVRDCYEVGRRCGMASMFESYFVEEQIDEESDLPGAAADGSEAVQLGGPTVGPRGSCTGDDDGGCEAVPVFGDGCGPGRRELVLGPGDCAADGAGGGGAGTPESG